jgi:hypothetical protein
MLERTMNNSERGTKRCTGCSTPFAAADWARLPIRQRIEATEVARLVSGWPMDNWIEVRVCSACGKPTAAQGNRQEAREAT